MSKNHGLGVDRRPWLILSRREAIALEQAARYAIDHGAAQLADLERALREIRSQLLYIDANYGEEPTPTAAVLRDEQGQPS